MNVKFFYDTKSLSAWIHVHALEIEKIKMGIVKKEDEEGLAIMVTYHWR